MSAGTVIPIDQSNLQRNEQCQIHGPQGQFDLRADEERGGVEKKGKPENS